MSNNATSNETDLDWLARNVHVWHEGANYVCVNHTDGGYVFHEHNRNCAIWFTRDQWLASRAELQNKPSWGAVPSHANWLAQDAAGSWLWHSSEPECRNGGWIGSTTRGYAAKGCVLGDWSDTLEKRPEGSMVSMSGVHSNGDMEKLLDELNDIDESIFGDGFIPKDAATAKQPAPKGSGSPILGMVLADLTNRALEGKEKYGEPLLAHNGRNPLWDAYQEALDLAMYLRQAIEELG